VNYRVRAFSHAYFEDIPHTVAIVKNVTASELREVITRYMPGPARRVTVDDEADWVEAELEDERWR
jgi:hypothetical protein